MSFPKRFLFPIIGVFVLLALYTAYWFHAKGVIEREALVWIARQETAGYVIEQDRIHVTGFPYRFQVELTAPRVHAPASDGDWYARMDMLKAHALPYDFSHWIIEFDGPLWLESGSQPGRVIEVNAELALVSLVSDSAGETRRIGAEINNLNISAQDGDQPGLQSVDSLLLSGIVGDDDTLRVRFEARGLSASTTAFTPDILRAFGQRADLARLDLSVTQWASLARDANASAWSRAGGQLEVAESALEWGPAHLSGVGDFTLDHMARPDGRLSLHVTDPDALADALLQARLVPAENEQGLRIAAMMAPRGPDGVALPFRIYDGGFYLGPVRLGNLDN